MKKQPSLLERRAAAAHATAKAKRETSSIGSARDKSDTVSSFSFKKMSLPSQAKASALKQSSPNGRRTNDRLSYLN